MSLVAGAFPPARSGAAGRERVGETAAARPRARLPRPARAMPDPSDLVLDLRSVRKAYAEGDATRVVLDGAAMRLPRGRIGALVGRSGAGKSTVLNLVSGIDRPDSGQVIVDGIDLAGLSERDRTLFRRRHIGFIFQFYNLVPTLTVEENVRVLLDLDKTPAAEAHRRAVGLLDAVGLADRADAFPDRLSGGEQQRVAIARALAHDPALVLADEPTGDLDAETGLRILDLLEALTREQGKTLLMVTHDRSTLGRADVVFTLAEGRIEDGGRRTEGGEPELQDFAQPARG